ncbi:MAG: hypothetical protein KA371_13395 [Acidobacteria bacterium]|nr:hypothetical protein [Acidobacteriota bacterium]
MAAAVPIGSVRDPHLAVGLSAVAQDITRAQFPLAHVRVTGDMAVVRDDNVRAAEAKGHYFVCGPVTCPEWTHNALLRERLVAGLSADRHPAGTRDGAAPALANCGGIAPDDPRAIAGGSAAFRVTRLVAAFVPSVRASRGAGGIAATRIGCKISPTRCVPQSRRCSRRYRARLCTRVAVLLSE